MDWKAFLNTQVINTHGLMIIIQSLAYIEAAPKLKIPTLNALKHTLERMHSLLSH